MNYWFSLIIAAISAIIDLWMFYKISDIEHKVGLKLFLAISVIMVGFISNLSLSTFGIFFANISEIIGLYLIYKTKNDQNLVLNSIILINTFDIAINLIGASIAIAFTETIGNYFYVVILLILIYLIQKYHKKIHHILTGKNSKIFTFILCYLWISTEAIILFTFLTKSPVTYYVLTIGLFVFQIIFSIITYNQLINIQKQLLQKQKQKQLQDYADYLEKSEDDLRAFRHDYLNILNSLKISAKEGNVQEVVEKLDKYTKNNLNSEALLKYKDVNHIQVKAIKSIIIPKLTEIYSTNIPYNFECKQNITNLPNIDEFDLVRIIGITIDNAIEESKILLAKAQAPMIQIMLYTNGTDFEYEVRNKIHKQNITVSKIQERGFTTKKGHKGMGLATINKLEQKYPEIAISYAISNNWFDFYLSVE